MFRRWSFTSLDAQREACAAYIQSQRHEGWRLVRERFDDGGYSGGNLERPALQKLLAAVEARRIDIVVVYKVDRLTRSLTDFAKLVERFDEQKTSFVSVTQQFNTTTSMGRLTLNVLLSFAQFEREVTAERIRDKIAASKAKGMWMGGRAPLGFNNVDKALVINKNEAEQVRCLFESYVILGSVRQLAIDAANKGICSKRRSDGSGGKPLTRGNLYRLLANPLYAGDVAHCGQVYAGQHEPIIERPLWEAVQARLANRAPDRISSSNTSTASLLVGLLLDDRGDRMCATYAIKKGVRYRYYISKRLKFGETGRRAEHNDGWRLRAETIEAIIRDVLIELLGDPKALMDGLGETSGQIDAWILSCASERAQAAAQTLKTGSAIEQPQLLQNLIARIDLANDRMGVTIKRSGVAELVGVTGVQGEHQLHRAISLRKRGIERKLHLKGQGRDPQKPDAGLCRTIARAHHWLAELTDGSNSTVQNIAKREGMHTSDVSRTLKLAFLAPDITEKILAGQQPPALTSRQLLRVNLAAEWPDQRRQLGFTT